MFPWLKILRSMVQKRIRLLLLICMIPALLVLGAAAGLSWMAKHWIQIETVWLAQTVNWLIDTVGFLGVWFVFPALSVLIAGVFQERVIHHVEEKWYPDRIRIDKPRFWPDIIHDIKFTIWALFLNVLILPAYIFGGGFVLSVLLNTYLLGREFFETSAGYHIGKPQARKMISDYRFSIYFGGLMITLLSLIPIVNCIMPIVAMIWMVHLYHFLASDKQTKC